MKVGAKKAALQEKTQKLTLKNVFSQKDFELLKQVPESPYQTGSFGQNQHN